MRIPWFIGMWKKSRHDKEAKDLVELNETDEDEDEYRRKSCIHSQRWKFNVFEGLDGCTISRPILL